MALYVPLRTSSSLVLSEVIVWEICLSAAFGFAGVHGSVIHGRLSSG